MIPMPTYPLKIVFIVSLLLLLAAGVWMAKNNDKLFGRDKSLGTETSGERFYSKTQMWICWLLAVKVCATLAVLL